MMAYFNNIDIHNQTMTEPTENPSQQPVTPPARPEPSGQLLNRVTGAFGVFGFVFMVLEKLGTFKEGYGGIEKIVSSLQIMPPWAWWVLLVGFILVALLYAYQEIRTVQERRAAHRLAKAGAEPKPGYFRIGPYLDKPEDRQEFRRADQAQVEVLDWLANPATHAMSLYLTGDSGTGKSSLLNASVLPQLRERGWAIYSARAYLDPEAALREALVAGRARRPKEDKTLRDLAESAAEKSPVLLLLDQFEEFLIVAVPEVQVRFAAFVQDLAQRPVQNLRLLLTLRSDYQRELGKVGLPFPHYNQNLYEVGRFDFAAARSFIAGSGLGLEASALAQLLDSAAVLDDTRGRIRPITLNVLGKILLEGRHSLSGLDAARMIREYLAENVEQTGVREFAKPVLEQLLTEQGTKQPKTQAEIATATRLEPYAVLAVLNGLGKAGLARPLDVSGDVWELSHDFVARALNAYLDRRPGELGRKALAYGSPALFAALLAALAVYEMMVAVPERAKREPILPTMVDIPAGGFCMGSRRSEQEAVPTECQGLPLDPESRDDETPVHWVKFDQAFKLGKYEVTVAEFERFALDTGRKPPGDGGFGGGLKPEAQARLPAIFVSFDDATAYAHWLSQRTGLAFRLPSEAEWEYAARAEKVISHYASRFWGDDPHHQQACTYANVLDQKALASLKTKGYTITWDGFACDEPNHYEFTAPVGRFQPNAFGLHDLLGNVWEWVADCYHENYKGAPEGQVAWVDGAECANGRRVIRGGTWYVEPDYLRSAYRGWDDPDFRDNDLGFRLAQDL